MSKRFNFDDFETLINEALGEMDEARLQAELTDGTLADQVMPGEIGGVIAIPRSMMPEIEPVQEA